MALEAESADDRRAGVVGLASSRDGQSDWAMKVYDTIARTDTDAMVRCAAVRAMAAAAGTAQVQTAIHLLRSEDQRLEDVRPAPGPVRAEATKLLKAVAESQAFEAGQRREIVEALLERLAVDGDRGVRLATIEALAYFSEDRVLNALIGAMEREEDFAVQHAAEKSLIMLTGTTNEHDAAAWRAWLASRRAPQTAREDTSN